MNLVKSNFSERNNQLCYGGVHPKYSDWLGRKWFKFIILYTISSNLIKWLQSICCKLGPTGIMNWYCWQDDKMTRILVAIMGQSQLGIQTFLSIAKYQGAIKLTVSPLNVSNLACNWVFVQKLSLETAISACLIGFFKLHMQKMHLQLFTLQVLRVNWYECEVISCEW